MSIITIKERHPREKPINGPLATLKDNKYAVWLLENQTIAYAATTVNPIHTDVHSAIKQ